MIKEKNQSQLILKDSKRLFLRLYLKKLRFFLKAWMNAIFYNASGTDFKCECYSARIRALLVRDHYEQWREEMATFLFRQYLELIGKNTQRHRRNSELVRKPKNPKLPMKIVGNMSGH